LDLKFAVPIRVGHIEFGKFGLDVAVLRNTIERMTQFYRPIQRRPLNCAQMVLPFLESSQLGCVINCIAQSSTQVTQLHMSPDSTLPD
jgi:hypothetical protein